MKLNPLFAAAETKWLGIGDEMNLMTAIRQLIPSSVATTPLPP